MKKSRFTEEQVIGFLKPAEFAQRHRIINQREPASSKEIKLALSRTSE